MAGFAGSTTGCVASEGLAVSVGNPPAKEQTDKQKNNKILQV